MYFADKGRLSRRRRSASFHLTSSITAHWGNDGFRLQKESSQRQHDKPAIVVVEPIPGYYRYLGHPAVESVAVQTCESLDADGNVVTSVQTIVNCTKIIATREMNQIVNYIYTGQVDPSIGLDLSRLKEAAEFLGVSGLYDWTEERIRNQDKEASLERESPSALEVSFFALPSLADVVFRLDDQSTIPAHKPVLMARCDVMRAMFTHDDFVERSAKVVRFQGADREDFEALLFYLYTDRVPAKMRNWVGVIELGNRLCLPRLVSLVETAAVNHLEQNACEADAVDEALRILQPCQVHNADQLSEWCLYFLAQSYNQICRKYPKVLRTLHPENQAWLNVHRWPPIWYLKDFDFYQRMQQERERAERPLKRPRRGSNGSGLVGLGGSGNGSGCLCFSSSKSRKGSAYDVA